MSEFYIYGIDVASHTYGLGWVKINDSGLVVGKGSGLRDLPSAIEKDIADENIRIAIGFEAVMWYPIPNVEQGKFEMKGRFEEELNYECHKSVATATTIKTILLSELIFSDASRKILQTQSTKDIKKFKEGRRTKDLSSRILLYEGFCAGKYKPNAHYQSFKNNKTSPTTVTSKNQVDAYVIALALLSDLTYHEKVIKFIKSIVPLPSLNSPTRLKVQYDDSTKNVKQYQGTSEEFKEEDYHIDEYKCIWELILQNKFDASEPKVCNVYGFKW